MKEPSFACVYSAQPQGISGVIVRVELDIVKNSMHNFSIIGVPDKAVEEARDRVGTALKNSHLPSPKSSNQKTVVSLLPAELRKEGSYYDVAIAVGYLIANGDIRAMTDKMVFLGELSLNGDIQSVRGVLPLVLQARNEGFTSAFVPSACAHEASVVEGITVYGVESLVQIINHIDPQGFEKILRDNKVECPEFQDLIPIEYTPHPKGGDSKFPEIATIKGQEAAKRACEIAAAGGHSIALYGPPGTGKTMLARAFTGLLPTLSLHEAIEVTSIHSVAGTLQNNLVTEPPFRSPHHTSSYVALVGGGAYPRPGEVTLAHKGVLFLDEFPEFDTRVLESLRQPLEDKIVTVSRARGTLEFPADFILVAAMNPCPCGYAGSKVKPCTCGEVQLQKYRKKLSGPLVDRIDLWVPVEHISYESLHDTEHEGELTMVIKERVKQARQRSEVRATESNLHFPNSLLRPAEMNSILLSESAQKILQLSAEKLQLSPRSYHRVMRVARTIADLDNSNEILDKHILEALHYRPKSAITRS